MDADELKQSLTKEQIIEIMASLGSGYKEDNNGDLVFQTICHNDDGCGSWKLYYYDNNKMFNCYTNCGGMSIFKLIEKVKHISFIKALDYVQSFFGFGIKKSGFTSESYELTDDWDLIKKYSDYEKLLCEKEFEYTIIPNAILTLFDNVYPIEWLNEGISQKTIDQFNIKMDLLHKKIIIPHYDLDNNLIGIRCRYLDPYDYDYLNRGKYNPLYLQHDKMYNHSLQNNLYGLNITKEAIQRIKKCIIFESEKSVMKCNDYYGENNFAVAICGHSISKAQRDMILNLGVKEVFIALDKDYTDEDSEEGEKCAESILKECYKFAPYVTTYLLWDSNETNLLEYKNAPCDKGKEVLEKLMKNKYEIITKEGENIGRKRKTTNRNL